MGSNALPLAILVAACLLGYWANAVKEPSEAEAIVFLYNRISHHLIVKTTHNRHLKCYIITLTDIERQQVHTDAGLQAIEMKYLARLVVARKATADQLRKEDRGNCGHPPRNGTVEYFIMDGLSN